MYALAAGFLGILRTVNVKAARNGARSFTGGAETCALMEFWGLDRKLQEIYCREGASGEEAWRAVGFIKAALARTALSAQENAPVPDAEALALLNYDAEDLRALLRINIFEDVAWYNKEAFEEALVLLPLFALMQTGKPGAKTIAAVTGAFRAAAVHSGYRLDRLIEALTAAKARPQAKRGGQTAKPAQGAKATKDAKAAKSAKTTKSTKAAKNAKEDKSPAKPRNGGNKGRGKRGAAE
jgi:hypothetical protein